ncbi:MAG TPA: glycosyltransferase family 4 protein, partial [Salinimicrobium sp.]|nr:glycosyltransferase family 4 protein [Salinimicrobium sp.]
LIRKKLPEAELHVYGGYPPKKAFDLHNPKTGFIVKGRAGSAKEVFRKSRVLISPLRFGAGLKGKFFDAMKYGAPAVTTAIGAEGINKNLPWNGAIEDDPEKFASAAVSIYCKKELWEISRQNGFTILKTRFDREKIEEDFKKSLSEMKNNLEEHRRENFIGAMLLHHTINATRYLSKYIEAKNMSQSD